VLGSIEIDILRQLREKSKQLQDLNGNNPIFSLVSAVTRLRDKRLITGKSGWLELSYYGKMMVEILTENKRIGNSSN
jgi:predicted transcriptional regulator